MAVTKLIFTDTYNAEADLSAKQYRFMKNSGDGGCTVCAAVTDKLIGVLQNTPEEDQEAVVMHIGVSKVVAGADLTAGETVGTDGNGAAVPYVHGTDTTKYAAGVCRVGAASGGIAEVTLGCLPPTRLA
ncbi:MAG: hypothetical protein IT357_12755 [Gemmatimonadaceae bacterium]|nr:hypothetical protein [Gemmatimonadaceae bacterium]